MSELSVLAITGHIETRDVPLNYLMMMAGTLLLTLTHMQREMGMVTRKRKKEKAVRI